MRVLVSESKLYDTTRWALPLAASLWLWEPVWDHYLMQYVPPMALLAALALHALASHRAVGRPLAVAVLVALTCVATAHVAARRPPRLIPLYASLTQQRWLTFDPFIHFITRTTPACGLIDPFNVYGDRSLTALTGSRFHIGPEELIACLDWDPRIRVGIGYWGSFFVDDRLRAWLEKQPPERFLPGSRYGPDDQTPRG